MKRSRFSEEQIIGILKEQEVGMPSITRNIARAPSRSDEPTSSSIRSSGSTMEDLLLGATQPYFV